MLVCMKLFAFTLVVSLAVWAQGATGRITGEVLDASGAVVRSAAVRAVDSETGVSYGAESNSAGLFVLAGLPAGSYDITASAVGFTSQKRSRVPLRVGEAIRLDFLLEPGAIGQTLEVTASAAITKTEDAALGTFVETRDIQELPLNGRQLQNLALLAPGIAAGWNWSTAANRYGKARENTEGAFVVNGARGRSNNFVLDGMRMNVRQYGVINFQPSNEAVREFELKASTPLAEFGGTMGATVNIATRAGGNAFHGSVYEFFRNDVLDANNTFGSRAGLPRGKLRQNQYGASVGGPIVRDRHFFFANYEQLRIIEGVETRLVSVPSVEERSGLVGYVNAAGAPQTLDLRDRINPTSRRLLDLYPAANTAGAQLNYTAPLTIRLVDTQFHIRTDHHLTQRDTVNFRISRNLNDQEYVINRFGGPYIPGFSLPNPERTLNGTIGYLRTINAKTANEFRFGMNRYANDLANGDAARPSDFGLPNGNETANGIPSLTFAGGVIEPLGGQPWFNREQNELTTRVSDTLSWLTGRHSLKFGGEFARLQFNSRGAFNQRGTISFDGSRNGLIPRLPGNERAGALADFLLGQPYEASIVVGAFGRGYRQSQYAFFAQDSWRIHSRLTLQLGLRWDYAAPWTEVNGKLSNLNAAGQLEEVGTGGLDRLYRPDRNNFAPRFGLAYDAAGDGSLVIRGGFAILYETLLQANSVQQVENNPPYSAFAVTRSPSPFPASGAASTLLDLRAQAQPSRAIAAVDSDGFRNPYTMQFHGSIQRRLGQTWLIEAAYVGSRGLSLPLFLNANQVPLTRLTAADRTALAQAIAVGQDTTPLLAPLRPFPGFDSVTLSRNSAQSTYHSAQLKLERRFTRGFSLLASYTFSKSIDNSSDFGSSDPSETVLNSYNLAGERAVSSFDVPHRFTSAFTYEIPYPRTGPLQGLAGGWQINGIITLQSGQPFTPFVGTFDPFRNEAFNRPDVIGDPRREVPAGLAFNPAAFRTPAAGTFGNAGRNIVRGDGFHSVDLSAFKNFTIHENWRLQVRAEAVNSFNQVNYQGPVTNINATPGAFVASAQPRIIQFGLKLVF
jgi:hypothetical protein